MRILLSSLILAFAVVWVPQVRAAACENFVGGVCLDTKVKPTVKQAVPKKVVPKKKAAPVEKPAPQGGVKTADSCVATKLSGKLGVIATGMQSRNVTIRNNCAKSVTVYIALSLCRSPPPFFWPFKGQSTKTIILRAGQRETMKIAHSESMSSSERVVKTSSVYEGAGKGGYPAFGC
jgi:hypothetical protein